MRIAIALLGLWLLITAAPPQCHPDHPCKPRNPPGSNHSASPS